MEPGWGWPRRKATGSNRAAAIRSLDTLPANNPIRTPNTVDLPTPSFPSSPFLRSRVYPRASVASFPSRVHLHAEGSWSVSGNRDEGRKRCHMEPRTRTGIWISTRGPSAPAMRRTQYVLFASVCLSPSPRPPLPRAVLELGSTSLPGTDANLSRPDAALLCDLCLCICHNNIFIK